MVSSGTVVISVPKAGRILDQFQTLRDKETLPKQFAQSVNSMLEMVAQDPVAQALIFKTMMELFLVELFGVLPEEARGGRGWRGGQAFTDGVVSSCRSGVVGDVRAFFGPAEAQERLGQAN